MTLKSAKQIWDFHKKEYYGDERIRGIKVLNLVREFEIQKIKESETIKEYSDKLISEANKVKLLGAELSDTRIVQKIVVNLPEKFEATIASLENTKDLSNITLVELLNSLQDQEQRRMVRNEATVEGALQASNSSNDNKGGKYPPCQHCGKRNHPHFKCWKKPDMRCRKCHKLGHDEITCNEKGPQQLNGAQIADEQEEDQLFMATCFASRSSSKSWLIDSGCTNHMTHHDEIFRYLDRSAISKVRIDNGDYLLAKGKGTVAFESYSGTKLISDVLYVPELDQNLLSIGKLLQNGFKLTFEDKKCVIFDPKGQQICQVNMRGNSFSFDPMEEKLVAYLNQEMTTNIWHKRLGHFHHRALL
ncbi:uncharacterized protein [Solanum tuberosum]|uniref:uncharacterized protein n=1 Tax=Solanum tuberosum TaxID=4113 RepID=UPI00073A08F1|nr:PREDICTED: uncharacterized protein LOC107061617 [Solanum tuberosum]